MRKNIVITGASSGLGEAMAKEFALMGRNLALCARRIDLLDKLKAELLTINPHIKIVTKLLDVNDHENVFKVFNEFKAELGSLDRVIVNAGMGQGAKIGTGNFAANKLSAMTNFIAAMAQCEAAVEIFRKQNSGHLVTISSMSALRGMPKNMTTYSAAKAALATFSEGIQSDLIPTPIKVTTIFPGYILTPINDKYKKLPFRIDVTKGAHLLIKVIERERAKAYVPWWPWYLVGFFLKYLPLKMIRKFI